MTRANSPQPSGTMAEAFCEKHLDVWTEYGYHLADWRDPDIFTNQERMLEHGGLGLSYHFRQDEDPALFIAVFHDRSWIVQSHPYGGGYPELGTGKDDGRFVDLIHEALQLELEALGDARAFADEQLSESFQRP